VVKGRRPREKGENVRVEIWRARAFEVYLGAAGLRLKYEGHPDQMGVCAPTRTKHGH